MKTRDRINVRLDEAQIKLIEAATKMLGNKMKESHVIRAAIDHYFACPASVLPNGKPLPRIASIELKTPELQQADEVKPKKRKAAATNKKEKREIVPDVTCDVTDPDIDDVMGPYTKYELPESTKKILAEQNAVDPRNHFHQTGPTRLAGSPEIRNPEKSKAHQESA